MSLCHPWKSFSIKPRWTPPKMNGLTAFLPSLFTSHEEVNKVRQITGFGQMNFCFIMWNKQTICITFEKSKSKRDRLFLKFNLRKTDFAQHETNRHFQVTVNKQKSCSYYIFGPACFCLCCPQDFSSLRFHFAILFSCTWLSAPLPIFLLLRIQFIVLLYGALFFLWCFLFSLISYFSLLFLSSLEQNPSFLRSLLSLKTSMPYHFLLLFLYFSFCYQCFLALMLPTSRSMQKQYTKNEACHDQSNRIWKPWKDDIYSINSASLSLLK